jgi:transcriptional regulator GlxA family with amidase domain
MKNVTIVAFEGSVEMSITIARDMFCAANKAQRKIDSRKGSPAENLIVVATQDGKEIRTFSGSVFKPDAAIADIEHTDLIIISGMWSNVDMFLANHQRVVEWLKRHYERGTLIACMHTGAFLLAEAGLLDGKVATIYWQMVDDFRARYPEVILQPERNITSADNLFCSAGIGSGLEMAIYLVERIFGVGVAQKVETAR